MPLTGITLNVHLYCIPTNYAKCLFNTVSHHKVIRRYVYVKYQYVKKAQAQF